MTIQTQEQPTGLRRYIPILVWLPHYQSHWLRADISRWVDHHGPAGARGHGLR